MSKNFFKALSTFCATIIGAGIFVLPYTASKFGFFGITIFLIVLSFLVIIIHRLLGEVVVGTNEIFSIPGYTEKYLGLKIKNFSLFISATRVVGVLLIYILLGGQFLYAFLNPYIGGSKNIFIVIFFAISSFLIYKKTKKELRFDVDIIGILIILLILLIKAWSIFDFKNLTGNFDIQYIGFPYGVLIFALWGLHTVPRLYELAEKNEKQYKRLINWGVILSAVFYLLFIILILGVSGINTSGDALTGFSIIVGGNLIKFGFIFGLMAVLTSLLALGFSLREIFQKDAMLSKPTAWIFACFLPFSLFLINFKDFVNIMSGIGSFLFTAEAIMVVFIYRKFFQSKFNKKPPLYTLLLLLFFTSIIIFEFWYFFIK